MNTYEYALQLGLTGSPEEVVDKLKSIKKHYKNVYITGGPANTESVNLLHLLTARHRVIGMNSAQQWIGPLVDLESTNQQVALIMSILRPMLQVNDTLVYCADSDDAADMLNAITNIVGQITGNSDQIELEVSLLSGGRVGKSFNSLTVEQYEQDKASYELIQSAKQALEVIRKRRQDWDTLSADIRSKISSNELTDSQSIIDYIQENG